MPSQQEEVDWAFEHALKLVKAGECMWCRSKSHHPTQCHTM